MNVTTNRTIAEQLASANFAGVVQLPKNSEVDSGLLLETAKNYAQVPTSGFRVGAVVEGESGALYLGANLEIEGAALCFTLHAEQSAVNNAYLHGETGIRQLWVSEAPCGHCRQFLCEIKDAPKLKINIGGEVSTTLEELLPNAFGPSELGNGKALFANRSTDVIAKQSSDGDAQSFAGQLLEYSYAPYTQSPSSVVITAQGQHFGGCCIESAAYNPSLSPLMSALDRFRFQRIDFYNIETVHMIEHGSSRLSQKSITIELLKAVAPEVKLSTLQVPTQKKNSKNVVSLSDSYVSKYAFVSVHELADQI